MFRDYILCGNTMCVVLTERRLSVILSGKLSGGRIPSAGRFTNVVWKERQKTQRNLKMHTDIHVSNHISTLHSLILFSERLNTYFYLQSNRTLTYTPKCVD